MASDELGYGALYVRICQEWERAEADVKRAEQVCEEVVIPSIMELRYAGRRLAQAQSLINTGGDAIEVTKLLNDACFNCHRARHDAIDAATSQISITLTLALKKLGYSPVLTAFPQFLVLRKKINAIRHKIAESRASAEKRDSIYETIEDAEFPDLIVLYEDFQSSEDVMKKLARSGRHAWVVAYAGLAFGIIGVIFGVIVYFLEKH